MTNQHYQEFQKYDENKSSETNKLIEEARKYLNSPYGRTSLAMSMHYNSANLQLNQFLFFRSMVL